MVKWGNIFIRDRFVKSLFCHKMHIRHGEYLLVFEGLTYVLSVTYVANLDYLRIHHK